MSKMQLQAKLVKKEQLKDDIFKFSVEAQEIVNIAKSGQFLEIRVTDQVEPFLRRPISIYNLDKENGILEFIFQVKGKGTKILAQKQEGELKQMTFICEKSVLCEAISNVSKATTTKSQRSNS